MATSRPLRVRYLPWLAMSPLLGVWCFQLDGIYIGATRTAEMRNGMILALAGLPAGALVCRAALRQ